MKNRNYLLIACIWLTALMAAHAHPTVAGRVKSFGNGILTIEMEDKSLRKLIISKETSVKYRGASSVASLPVGAKVSVEIIGNVVANPAKAGKIVDWSNSAEIVAVGAKSPYYTSVGQYATTSGNGGTPEGAPVGQHAASHTLAAVGHGGSVNQPTMENHSVNPTAPPDDRGQSTMGQPYQSTQYMNQGTSTTAPLEMLNINPYGNGQPAAQTQGGQQPMSPGTDPSGSYGTDPSGVMQPGMYPGMDPASQGMQQPGMYGNDPSMGMNPQANPGMYGDPSLGMSNPYTSSNLGTGQSGNLMGINGGEDGEYSTSGDMMGLGDSAYGGGDNKITGSILQVDLQRGRLTIQSFTSPNPQVVLMGPGSSASPDLLIPGKMVEVTGRPTPNGFQAMDIQPAPGF